MRIANYTRKFLLILLCGLFFTSCSKLTSNKGVNNTPQVDNPYTMPADGYLALAENNQGAEKQALLILAAGQLIIDGQLQKSSDILAKIKPLSDEISAEKMLLEGKISLISERPNQSINKLANIRHIDTLPAYYQIQYHEVLASAYFLTNHPVEAVHERIKLDDMLTDNISKISNRLALWMALTTLSGPEVNVLATEAPDDETLNGWIQLANISRQNTNTPQETLDKIGNWQAKFPNHSGNQVLPDLSRVKNFMFAPPRKIALLLPLTGQLAGPGKAIKDGFMAALEESSSSYNVNVQFYNTSAEDIKKLYAKAIQDGAEYVVGPLAKNQVAEIAKIDHPVPTLLLNETEFKPRANSYQFGLSPSNEARQIAAKIRKKGLGHALVIAPEGTWGQEIVEAFATQYRRSGGQVVETFYFKPDDDLTTSIRELLHVVPDKVRKKIIEENSDEPIRREDFDVIFLVAYPTKARQIVPMLRYYFAGNVPVYATSNVYSGSVDKSKDRDLNNVTFTDMPWIFSNQISNQNWPEQFNSYNRLYALGMDAYSLAIQLNQLLLFPAVGINNKSGIIYLNNAQEISRILMFGKFKDGEAQLRPYF